MRGGPPCGVRHGRPRTPECRAPGPRPHARVACTASSLLGLQWHPLSAARRSSRCLRLAAVQLLPCAAAAVPCSCCRAAAAAQLLPCSSCRAAPAVQLLPCSCCRAAPAVQLLPCSSCCRAAPAVQLLPCSSCRAASAGSASTGRQRWSRHERSARVLRAAAPGAKSPRHPAGRRARSAAAKTPPSTLCCGASRRRCCTAARQLPRPAAPLPPASARHSQSGSRHVCLERVASRRRGVSPFPPPP